MARILFSYIKWGKAKIFQEMKEDTRDVENGISGNGAQMTDIVKEFSKCNNYGKQKHNYYDEQFTKLYPAKHLYNYKTKHREIKQV